MSIKLRVLGPNQTELDTGRATIFFSYETPVAALVPGRGFIRTDRYWSVTTSRHINRWLSGADAEEVAQSELDGLLD